MDSDQIQSQSTVDNSSYMKIFQAEQEFMKTRWTITTFFMGVSFAVIAFSFQVKPGLQGTLAIRIFGLLIYWLAYFLYLHFYGHTKALRAFLINMETSGGTTIHLQSWIEKLPKYKAVRSTRILLFFFGLIYTIGVVLLLLLAL